jgi:histidinol-phosphate/aromatic aminotransferase/cobyric acid decarboxylase-like protein
MGRAEPVAAHRSPPRPDPRSMRAVIAFTGVAAASAMATAIVRPPAQPIVVATPTVAVDPTAAAVRHVTRYVQLLPGQTPPPIAVVEAVPQPTPRVVVITTHQSGVP